MGAGPGAASIVGRETHRVSFPPAHIPATPGQHIGRSVSENAGPAHGGVSLSVSPWALRGAIPALGHTPALRGYPGGIDAAGPGWPGPAGDGQPEHGPGPARGTRSRADDGSGIRGTRRRADDGSGIGEAMTGAGGGSVWQQALGAWREAGLEWQRPAGWEPADADLQRTEPIPVVSATATAADVGLAPSPAGPPAGPSPGGGRAARAGAGVAERAAGRDGGQHPGPHPRPGWQHPRRSTRSMLVGAGVCVALLAVAVAGIVITGPLNAGPDRGLPGLVVAYPPARLADGQFAGLGGSPGKQVPPSLTGVAAAGSTVVAVGSRAALPSARPLVLMSPDGGRTWQPAVLRAQAGGPAAGPGAVPLMVAGGPGRWLAVGPDATWLSPDGRSWRLGPGIAPLAAGDRVQALARTGGGFVAVGENVRLLGAHVARTPVLWMSANGLTWQRQGPSQLGLPAGKGQVLALRWVAARGGVLMIGGEVARTVVEHRGKRKLRVLKEFPAVWRSQDDAAHWLRADPPASRGATARLAGLAATGSGIVAIRPGRSASGVRDAVAYIWGRGPGWRFAGKLRARRGAALNVTSVAGSDQGAVAARSAGRYQVAFVSVHGRSWHQTADLGRSSSAAVTGVTVGPGGKVVAAGASAPRPFLLLARGHRLPVGQAALAGAADLGPERQRPQRGPGRAGRGRSCRRGARGMVTPGRWPVGADGSHDAAVLAWNGSRAHQRRPWRRGLAGGRQRGRPGGNRCPGGRDRHARLRHRSRWPAAADPPDLTGREGLAPGRRRRAPGGARPHPDRRGGGAFGLCGGWCAGHSRPAGRRAVVVGRPHHLDAAGMVDGRCAGRRPVRAAGRRGWQDRFRRRGRHRHAPGRLALQGRPLVAVTAAGPAGRCQQCRAPAGGHPGTPHRRSRHAGAGRPGRHRSAPSRSMVAVPGGRQLSRCPPDRGQCDRPRRGGRGFPRHRNVGCFRGPGRGRVVVARRACLARGPACRADGSAGQALSRSQA